MLTASILTMLISPGLAFYYAGRCQSKNVIIFSSLELSNANCSFVLSTPANIFHPDQAVGTMIGCLAPIGVVSLQWTMFGWSLCFSDSVDTWGIVGDLKKAMLRFTSSEHGLYKTGFQVSALTECSFRMTVAVAAASLVYGGGIGRIRPQVWMVFVFLWTTFVYDPISFMVWNE